MNQNLKPKPTEPNEIKPEPKLELNLIIGFGQIGSSIYDRFKYLKNQDKNIDKDIKRNFDIKVFDIHQFRNENDFVTNKIGTIEFNKYTKINFICCIDTKPGQDLFNTKNSISVSSLLLKTFFENKEHFNNEDTEVNIIIESTVPVGSAEKLYHKIVKQDIVLNLVIYSSPERYLEAYQPSDFPIRTNYQHPFELRKDYTHSERKIIGVCDPDCMEFDSIIYKRIQNYMDAWTNTGIEFFIVQNSNEAELSKLLENHLRYTQLTTMNLFKNYIIDNADIYGYKANVENIFKAIQTKDQTKFDPGLIGGGCIPVDSDFLLSQDEVASDYPSFPRKLMDNHIQLNHEINTRYKKNITVRLQNLINIYEKLAIRKGTDLEIYFLGIGYKKNSPTTENSKILDIIGSLDINSKLNIKLNFVDNFVEDYNNSCIHKPNFRKKQIKIYQDQLEYREPKEYQLIPFIDFMYMLNNDKPDTTRMIIINHDNDVKINNKQTNYSSYLSYKEIKYFKIGELK